LQQVSQLEAPLVAADGAAATAGRSVTAGRPATADGAAGLTACQG